MNKDLQCDDVFSRTVLHIVQQYLDKVIDRGMATLYGSIISEVCTLTLTFQQQFTL